MNKTELENAIKNGESVWLATEYEIKELKKLKLKDGLLVYYNEDYKFNHSVEENYFDDLYKTKAEAEHYLHHANISRIEHLPFLTWEEFCEQKFIWFIDKNQNECCLYYLNVSNKIFINVSGEVKEIGDLTEANFYKAYDECVALFRGKVND